MKESWGLGRIAGIGIRLHVTFPLLLVWVALVHVQRGSTWAAFGADAVLALVVFAIVVLHELGHALMARRFGIGTRDITLLPIGGVARLERMPERPAQELAVALAGPAVNVVLAGVLAALRWGLPDGVAAAGGWGGLGGFLTRLVWINAGMAAFNLLPAFPMDGGRVLRALLALRLDYVAATSIAARIGQGLALVAGVAGLFTNPFLVLIAVFVWMGAGEEAALIRIRSSLARVPVADMSVTQFETLPPEMPLAEAAGRMRHSYQPVFPVVADGRLLGLLSRERLLGGVLERGSGACVREVMEAGPEVVQADAAFAEAAPRFEPGHAPVVPVVREGRVVGLLGAGSIAEYLRFHEALEPRARPPSARRRGPAAPAPDQEA